MSGYGCYGCTGGCYGFSCHGCYGHGPTTSCAGYNYAPGYTTPGYTTPGMPLYGNTVPGPVTNPSTNKPAQPSTNDNKTKASISNTPANLAIEVPADAKLYVDGKLTTSTSEVRKFVTPPLQQGQVYFYDLRAEVDRDGQRIAVNGRVIIRAGQNVRAQLSEPSQKGTFLVSAD
ncbi:MAG: TIGR03000 domain-containing protein [Gemmataceae bacterium]